MQAFLILKVNNKGIETLTDKKMLGHKV